MSLHKTFPATYVSAIGATLLCAGAVWAQAQAAPAPAPAAAADAESTRILTESAWSKKTKANFNRPNIGGGGNDMCGMGSDRCSGMGSDRGWGGGISGGGGGISWGGGG